MEKKKLVSDHNITERGKNLRQYIDIVEQKTVNQVKSNDIQRKETINQTFGMLKYLKEFKKD